jgi:hypothetical protein
MDNYIVRVYRRDSQHSEAVIGLVESVEAQEKQPFHSLEELCNIVGSVPGQLQEASDSTYEERRIA